MCTFPKLQCVGLLIDQPLSAYLAAIGRSLYLLIGADRTFDF